MRFFFHFSFFLLYTLLDYSSPVQVPWRQGVKVSIKEPSSFFLHLLFLRLSSFRWFSCLNNTRNFSRSPPSTTRVSSFVLLFSELPSLLSFHHAAPALSSSPLPTPLLVLLLLLLRLSDSSAHTRPLLTTLTLLFLSSTRVPSLALLFPHLMLPFFHSASSTHSFSSWSSPFSTLSSRSSYVYARVSSIHSHCCVWQPGRLMLITPSTLACTADRAYASYPFGAMLYPS
jgi:hypothetical protein